MNYKSLSLLIIAFVFMFSIAQAQPVSSTTYETMLETADEAADNSDYANAIEWFDKAYKESKDKNLKVVIGDLYMLLRDYKRAERAYNIVLKRDRDGVFEDIRVDYARALKFQGKYKEALGEFRVVASTTDNDTLKQIALFELDGIEKMDTYSQNLEAVIDFADANVNSGSGENSPSQYVDGSLYFSSFNRKSEIILDGDEEDYQAKIYYASKNDEGEYEKPKALNKKINREGYNTAGVSFSGDGRKMYFTRTVLNVNDIEESKIYYSLKSDSGWGAAQELEAVNGDFLAMHPIEGELFGNRVLFFTSDMEGGYGGYDIYYSTISGDSYSIPVNVGASVNTEGDEITPFYQDGTLYYSTDGRPGFGGYDIWYATWNGSAFEDETNMGYNYNTAQDDMYMRFSPQGSYGFLVSNRPHKMKKKLKGSETCCDDIYTVQLREIVIDLLLMVVDENGPIKEATVELIDLSSDDEDSQQSKTNVNANDFNFLLDNDHEYRVVVSHDEYYPDTSVSFNTVGLLDSYTVKKTVTLKPKPKVDTNDGSDEGVEVIAINQPIRLNNIYYDYDKWDILEDAEDDLAYLQTLMEKYDNMVIELSSHTDARGPDDYNQRLSKRRAQSAKDWLVARGVASDRIKAVGYGETVILNQCKNGVKCSDTEHRQNRRTEFKIIAGPQTIEIKRETIRKKTSSSGGSQSWDQKYPIISFVKKEIDLGVIEKGQKVPLEFHFTNTGDEDLIIELVTTCKCTDIEWPEEAVKPGEQGVIKAIYDTTNQKLGEITKTIDIIANTEIIVVEAKFKSTIVEPSKKVE